MRSSLTGFDIFNAVMMQRSIDKRLVLILESPEDTGVIDPHVNESELQTFPGYGKEAVLAAAELFFRRRVEEVMAVVDADLDRYTGRQQSYSPNVVTTEFYDLDVDVIVHCPPALDAIIANFADKSRRQAYLASRGISVRDAIWEMACAVGEIRYCSVSRDWGLNLGRFPLHEILDGYERGIAQASVLTLALARTAGAGSMTLADVATEVAAVADKRLLASGHDLISALAALMRMRWSGTAGEKVLAAAMRSAIQCQCWKETVVYRIVGAWASQFDLTAWTCP